MSENKRAFFRLTNFEKPIEIVHKEQVYTADLRDISGNGISFYTTDRLPLEEEVLVRFQLEKTSYAFVTKLIREQEGTIGRRLYAGMFMGQTAKQQSTLSAHLLRLEASRRKS